MAWVRLDDGFYDNPKILTAGLAAIGLYVKALAYAARKLTDGFIPESVVCMLGDGEEDLWTDYVLGLVNLGLWHKVERGYQIHDYLSFNPSRAQVEARRKLWKEAGKRGGKLSRIRHVKAYPQGYPQGSRSKTLKGSGNGKGNGILPSGSLFPSPDPETEDPAKNGFLRFWDAYPRRVGKQDAREAWRKLKPPPLDAILTALAWQRKQPRWQEDAGRFIPYPATYLNHRRWEDEPPQLVLAGTTTRTAGNLEAIKAGLELLR